MFKMNTNNETVIPTIQIIKLYLLEHFFLFQKTIYNLCNLREAERSIQKLMFYIQISSLKLC